MVAVTVADGGDRHWPVLELVWQTVAAIGKVVSERRTRAVNMPPTPTLLDAVAKMPVPPTPPVWAKPSLEGVRPMAITSGTGLASKVSSSVLTPTIVAAASTPSQAYPSTTSIGTCAESGSVVVANATTKLWLLPGGIEILVLGEPVRALVLGSVV